MESLGEESLEMKEKKPALGVTSFIADTYSRSILKKTLLLNVFYIIEISMGKQLLLNYNKQIYICVIKVFNYVGPDC